MKNLTITSAAVLACFLLFLTPASAEKAADLAENLQYSQWLLERGEMWQSELSLLESRAGTLKFEELRELVEQIKKTNSKSIEQKGHHDSPSPTLLLNVMHVERELQGAFAAYPASNEALTLR